MTTRWTKEGCSPEEWHRGHPEGEAARGHRLDPRPASRDLYRYDRTKHNTSRTANRRSPARPSNSGGKPPQATACVSDGRSSSNLTLTRDETPGSCMVMP